LTKTTEEVRLSRGGVYFNLCVLLFAWSCVQRLSRCDPVQAVALLASSSSASCSTVRGEGVREAHSPLPTHCTFVELPWLTLHAYRLYGTIVLAPGADLAPGSTTRSLGKERTEMEPTKFDELTKALATSTSRRQALKTIAATTLGGILGLGGIGTALASNSACAKFCNAVFGANTPAANQCISDAAHGKGLCHQCGSATPTSICCTRNSSGFCSSYSGAHCPCDSSQCLTCDSTSGTCVSSCTSGQTCCSGTCSDCPCGYVKLSNGTCAKPCTTNADCPGCSSGCSAQDISGAFYCANTCTVQTCTTESDCPSGQFCSFQCGEPAGCVPAC